MSPRAYIPLIIAALCLFVLLFLLDRVPFWVIIMVSLLGIAASKFFGYAIQAHYQTKVHQDLAEHPEKMKGLEWMVGAMDGVLRLQRLIWILALPVLLIILLFAFF